MSQISGRGVIYKIVLFGVLVFISGRIVIHGIAAYYLQDALDGSVTAIHAVNSWQPDNPKGVYLKAKLLESDKPLESEGYLYRALSGNPADVRPIAVLARIKSLTGDVRDADKIMLLASRSMPANKSLHLRAANYWVERKNLQLALQEWSKALVISPALGKQLFPLFTRVLENADTRHLLRSFAIEKPAWWEKYFVYAMVNVKGGNTASIQYLIQSQSNEQLTDIQRRALIKRYIKDENWKSAYIVWVGGLTSLQRSRLAGVFDGSFEGMAEGELFGWNLIPMRYTHTRIRPTFGAVGKSALYIKFDNEEARYRQVYQNILLPPGNYKFTSVKRTDKLAGRGRLKWIVTCIGGQKHIIAKSRALLPSIDWEQQGFSFTIPATDDCQVQRLSLESIGKHLFDHKITGALWIDNIRVKRVRVASSGQ